MYSSLSTSRGDGNAEITPADTAIKIAGIDTNLPREGPETFRCYRLLYTYFLVCIDTYEPREGPETMLCCKVFLVVCSV